MTQAVFDFVSAAVGGLNYWTIFLLMAVESSAFPFPSEVVMLPAGYLVAQGKLDFWLATLAGGAGSLVGAWFNYYVLGRWLGRPFLEKYGRWVFVPPENLALAERYFQAGAVWYTFAGRLIPVVRQLISVPAGIFRMRPLPFSLLTFAGATLWCAVLVGAGWAFGERTVALLTQYSHFVAWALSAAASFFAAKWALRRWGWKRSFPLYFGILALLYPAGFLFVSRLEMAAAFPREAFQRMTLPAEHVFLTGAAGNRISAAWSPAGTKGAPVVLYFHGNGGPLAMWGSEVEFFNALGSSVLAPDYPGYGESSGSPTEANVYDMAEKAFSWLVDEKKIAPSRVVIVGFSVGTGPAAELALRRPEAGGLVLLAPYESMQSMAKALYGFAPQRLWFRPDTFATAEKIGRITMPTIVAHGDADPVIPFSQGKAVFEASGAVRKRFVELPGAGHSGASEAGVPFEAAWRELVGTEGK